MAMSLDVFCKDILNSNLKNFTDDPKSRLKAFNLIGAVDAFAAHIFAEAKNAGKDPFDELGFGEMAGHDDSAFRGKLAEQCWEFDLLRDAVKFDKPALAKRHVPVENGDTYTTVQSGEHALLIVREVNGICEIHSLASIVEKSVGFLSDQAKVIGISVSGETLS